MAARTISGCWPTAFALAALVASQAAIAEVLEQVMRVAGATVHYKVVLPADYDPEKEYPAVLVFGGGPQTMDTVDRTLERNFRAEAERRGYIVVAPAAPDGEQFFREGDRIFPEFLEMILGEYRIEERKFHVAGPSNGGISALHVAAKHPQYFRSVTAFPGYLWQPTDAKLIALSSLCVFLYIGERDEFPWHSEMQREAEFLRARGALARYTVEKGQPHRIETLAGAGAARLFEGFEEAERGCTVEPEGRAAPARVEAGTLAGATPEPRDGGVPWGGSTGSIGDADSRSGLRMARAGGAARS
ncbi:MAG TPA: alpha/beta hydrolase-fold protein [Gammaproteobacteria bacterium]